MVDSSLSSDQDDETGRHRTTLATLQDWPPRAFASEASQVYDEATGDAVSAYNSDRGSPEGALVGKDTLKLLMGSIRIDLSERKLTLFGR